MACRGGMPFAPIRAVTPRTCRALALAFLAAACRPADGRVQLVGTVERTLVEVVAPVSEVVTELPVERGTRVEAGQVVARLDPTIVNVEVARAEAALAAARTGARVADIELERVLELRRGNVAAQRDADQARLVRDEAEARLREAKAVLAAARKHLRDLMLVSPVAGTIDQLPFERGERVPAGAVLAVVLSDDVPWVRVFVPETAVATVAAGTRARVRVDGVPATLEGHVLDVAREPEFTPHYALTERDRVHLVYETRVRIENAPAKLRPGVPAEVELLPAETSTAEASP
jgi:HlyD family secretion protein